MSEVIMKTKLLVTIIDRDLEDKFIKMYQKKKIAYNLVFYGKGTIRSESLEYFGLDDVKKAVILSVLPVGLEKKILMDLHQKMKIYEPGKGIVCAIPIRGASRYFSTIYENAEAGEGIRMKMDEKYQLVVTIVEEGYAELAMGAAKKVGATGGTLIQGKGMGSKEAIKFLGLTIEPEKDVVLILIDKEKQKDLMKEIAKSAGLSTKGRGICFSLPVDDVVGLSENIVFEEIK